MSALNSLRHIGVKDEDVVSRPLLALFLFAGLPALAQPSPRLGELEAAHNAARDAHHDAIVKIQLLEQQARRTKSELAGLTRQVRSLQAQEPGVMRDRLLQSTRREQNKVSRELATLKLRIRAGETTRGGARVKLIQAKWALVSRLLELADRMWRSKRPGQAKTLTDRALRELKRLEDLEALEDPQGEGYEPEPVDPEASLEELAWLRDLYEGLADEFTAQVRALQPMEDKLVARVKHLERLVRYRYAVPTLGERLSRARDDLERVASLRRKAEVRAARTRKEITAIDAARSKRGLEGDDGG